MNTSVAKTTTTSRCLKLDTQMHKDTNERYTHGHHSSVVDQHRRRTVEEAAAFLLPHIEPTMSILDLGCGPGSITIGLARQVPDGGVVGIDIVSDVLEQARELAIDTGTSNVSFNHGDLYSLDYPDNSFDVVYAHQVLQHLTEPISALREIRRLLTPGGIVAVRDADYGTMVHSPDTREIVRWLELYHQITSRNGGEPNAGRYLNGWLHESGFEEIEMSASTWVFHKPAQLLNWGDSWGDRVTKSSFAEHAIEYGLCTVEELEAIANAWRRWARTPNAFFSFLHVEGLGRTSQSR